MNLEYFHKSLVESLPDMVWGFDNHYILRVANSAFLDMRNNLYNIELKIGDSLFKGVSDKIIEKWKPLYDRALQGERIILDDSRNINGVNSWVKLSLNPVKDADGHTIGCLGITYDISNEIIQESQLKKVLADYQEVNKIYHHQIASHLIKFFSLFVQLNNTNQFNEDDQNAMIFMINGELSQIGKKLNEISDIIERIKPI
jgi:PAS domain S-box-containing protein